jgi:ketosteroid isomerase-like protein
MESSGPGRDTAWAMSEENVALVRQSFDAWNEGGPESAKQFWAEDFEWHDFPDLPDRRVVRGRDAVVAHLTDQLSLLGELTTTIVEIRSRVRQWCCGRS